MANHEVNITCRNCNTEFDARLHGTQCPNCKTEYNFNPNKPKIMSKLFHFSEAQLKVLEYSIDAYYDKNHKTDKFPSRYIQTFKKAIDEDMSIEITFVYDVDKDTRHTLTDSSVSLVVNGIDKPLSMDNLWQIEWFYMSIKNHLKELA